MSIRIKNNSNGRIIIIKNQDDMFNLDNDVSSIDDTEVDPQFSGKETDSDEYDLDDSHDFNDIDDSEENHYINATAYSLDDEKASWDDPSTVDAPINKIKDPSASLPMAPDQEDDFNLDSDTDMDDEDSLDDDFFGEPNNEDGETPEDENPDFQGLIRTVRGACLVYKRKTEDGTYDELWIYNVGDNLKQETIIRKAILAGTDIDPNTQMSDDGQQRAKTQTIGNVQYLNITGMVQ